MFDFKKTVLFTSLGLSSISLAIWAYFSDEHIDSSYHASYKLVMPNQYAVQLQAKRYVIWQITEWKKINYVGQQTLAKFEVVDAAGKSVNLEKRNVKPQIFPYCGETGFEAYYAAEICPEREGKYTFKCLERNILVIVPAEDIYIRASSWPTYPGCAGTFDFVKPQKLNSD
ncbi:MAG: hypothetical protein J0H83_05770 [Candidatus Melainabacteria bacterium]|nr:hypothetical protein [Candidatus Melainabacteria bacterium]